MIRLGNNEVLKTLTKTLTFVDANANADAGGSTIALRERCSGELKMQILRSCYKTFFFLTHMECQNAIKKSSFSIKNWNSLMISTLGKFFRRCFDFFFLFSQKKGCDISYKLSQWRKFA